eukprot:gene2755-4163_t
MDKQTTQPHLNSQLSQNDSKQKKRRAISRKACENCRKSHACCSENRPCKRCSCLQVPCFDIPSKKRGRKRKFSDDENPEEETTGNNESTKEAIQNQPTTQPMTQPTLKQVLPKTNFDALNLPPKNLQNKEYRMSLYSSLFPQQKEIVERSFTSFWEALDNFMLNNYLAVQISNNLKPFNTRFGCPMQSLSGDSSICYLHEDCLKKELFSRISNSQNNSQMETKDDKKKSLSDIITKSYEKFQQFLDIIQVGVLLVNNDDGAIVSYNNKLKEILKVEDSSLKEHKWYDLDLIPNDLEISEKIKIKLDSSSKAYIFEILNEKESKLITLANFMELKYSLIIVQEDKIKEEK